jgi:hypothetical protein
VPAQRERQSLACWPWVVQNACIRSLPRILRCAD